MFFSTEDLQQEIAHLTRIVPEWLRIGETLTGKLQYINISTRPGMSDYKVERAIKEAFKKSPH